MKAIVLTFDKYKNITDHMIERYQSLWPDNPFVFRVPYQTFPNDLKTKYGEKIELIQSDSKIVPTLNTLLKDLDDDEWVYWCIDDRYPLTIDTKQIADIYKWLHSSHAKDTDGICFAHNKQDWNPRNLLPRSFKITDPNGRAYYRIANFKVIWFHQFLRAKVLKELVSNFPDSIKNAKEMDAYKDKAVLPAEYKRFLLKERLATFGESSNRGKLTRNCVASMEAHGIEVPKNIEVLDHEIFKGVSSREKPAIYYFVRNIAMRLGLFNK